jgi:hypothetical protein
VTRILRLTSGRWRRTLGGVGARETHLGRWQGEVDDATDYSTRG